MYDKNEWYLQDGEHGNQTASTKGSIKRKGQNQATGARRELQAQQAERVRQQARIVQLQAMLGQDGGQSGKGTGAMTGGGGNIQPQPQDYMAMFKAEVQQIAGSLQQYFAATARAQAEGRPPVIPPEMGAMPMPGQVPTIIQNPANAAGMGGGHTGWDPPAGWTTPSQAEPAVPEQPAKAPVEQLNWVLGNIARRLAAMNKAATA